MGTRFDSLATVLGSPVEFYTEGDGTLRHASWLELFFDLVFVIAIAELTGLLHADTSPLGVAGYAGLFALVWWTWLGFSYYADLFDTTDLFSRLALIAVMFGVIILSQTIGEALHGGSFAFAAAYLLLRVLYLGLMGRAWFMATDRREFLTFWILFSGLATVVWAVSLLVPVPGRYALWISTFLLSLAGVGVSYLAFDTVPVQVSHFPERLGLFTILVLGETVLVVAVGTEGTDWLLRSGVTALGGFMIAVTAWWLYFVHFDERTINVALEETEGHWLHMRERMMVYVFGHYFVFAGIVAAGVGLGLAIEAAVHHELFDVAGRTLMAGGIAAFLLGVTVCQRAMPNPLDRDVLAARLLTIGLVLAGAVVGRSFQPALATTVVALLMVNLVVYEGLARRLADPLRGDVEGPAGTGDQAPAASAASASPASRTTVANGEGAPGGWTIGRVLGRLFGPARVRRAFEWVTMPEVFLMWRDSRMVIMTVIVTAVYGAVLIPTKGLVLVPGLTEIRLANAFPVVFSLLFGPAAAWGTAFGNLFADAFGGTLSAASLFGFLGNFFFGLVGYKLWGNLGVLSCGDEPTMRSREHLVEFAVVAAVAAAGTAAIIGWGLEVLGLLAFSELATVIAVNNFVVAAVLGPPLLYLLYPVARRSGLLYPDLMARRDLPRVPATRQRRAGSGIAAVALLWLGLGLAYSVAMEGAGFTVVPGTTLVPGGAPVQVVLGAVAFLALLALLAGSGERLSQLLDERRVEQSRTVEEPVGGREDAVG